MEMKPLVLALCITLIGCGASTIHQFANANSKSQYWLHCDGANWIMPTVDVILSAAMIAVATGVTVDMHSLPPAPYVIWSGDDRSNYRDPDYGAIAAIFAVAGSLAMSGTMGYIFYAKDCPAPDGYVEEQEEMERQWNRQVREHRRD